MRKQVRVEFTYDDGYGGEYPIKATVNLWTEAERRHAEVIEMDGLLDRDGGWLAREEKACDEEAIEAAWRQHDLERAEELGFNDEPDYGGETQGERDAAQLDIYLNLK